MGAGSRRKGRAFEQELVQQFREALPETEVRRGLQSRSGREAADVDAPPFWVEAKRGKKPNVRGAFAQAVETAPEGRIPVAVIRDDREAAFAVLSLSHFLQLARGIMLSVALIAITGCGAAQRVAECTLAEAQPAMKPLGDAIMKDAVTGRYAPTKVLKQDVQLMVVEYGRHLVVCALEELIRKWKEELSRSAVHNTAVGIAEQLRDSL